MAKSSDTSNVSQKILVHRCDESDVSSNETVLTSGRRLRRTDKIPYSDRVIGDSPTPAEIKAVDMEEQIQIKEDDLKKRILRMEDLRRKKMAELNNALIPSSQRKAIT